MEENSHFAALMQILQLFLLYWNGRLITKVKAAISSVILASASFLFFDNATAKVDTYDLTKVDVQSARVRDDTYNHVHSQDYPVKTNKGEFQAADEETISKINKRCAETCTLKIKHKHGKIINIKTIIDAQAFGPNPNTPAVLAHSN